MYRLLRINGNPDLLPVKVRAYAGGTAVLMALIVFLSNSDAWHKSAACGLILGIFGSGALYWETIIDDVALRSVSNEIARMSSRRLSFSEVVDLLELSYLAKLLFFFVLLPLLLVHFKTGHNSGLRTVQGLFVALAVCGAPVAGYYIFMRTLRLWCGKWFQRFQENSQLGREVQTKQFLRAVGFASLFISGMLQVPATLL